MKIRNGLVILVSALALSAVPARAATITITSTIPGADFSLPDTIGTFTYSLPPGSTIALALLFSPEYTFAAAPAPFFLKFGFDGPTGIAFERVPTDTGFFLGEDVTLFEPVLRDGSLELSVDCLFGPCPGTYTRVSGDWRLVITTVPEPSTLLLVLLGSAGAARMRLRGGSSPDC